MLCEADADRPARYGVGRQANRRVEGLGSLAIGLLPGAGANRAALAITNIRRCRKLARAICR